MPETPLLFLVFSYNRGRFLENCVASVERHAPGCEIIVIDDRSDDPATRESLAGLAERHEVLMPSVESDQLTFKFGGLYHNLQLGLDAVKTDELICTLQDDMQLVRDVTPADYKSINASFDSDVQTGFLHHAFMKGEHRERYKREVSFDQSSNVYVRSRSDQSSGIYFSAIFIARADRLRAVDWKFRMSEPANSLQAARHFKPMGYLRDPFAMWLPCVPSHRHRRKTWAIKRGEKQIGAGYYPFRSMDEAAARAFVGRDHGQLPIAEDFIVTEPEAPISPWVYGPLRSRQLKWLHQIENRLLPLR